MKGKMAGAKSPLGFAEIIGPAESRALVTKRLQLSFSPSCEFVPLLQSAFN
jgi:hypothetical protein